VIVLALALGSVVVDMVVVVLARCQLYQIYAPMMLFYPEEASFEEASEGHSPYWPAYSCDEELN